MKKNKNIFLLEVNEIIDESLWQSIGNWILNKKPGIVKPEKIKQIIDFLLKELRNYVAARGNEEFIENTSEEFESLARKLNIDVLSKRNRDEIKNSLLTRIHNTESRRQVIIFFTKLLNNMIKRDFDMTNERERKLFEALKKRRAAKKKLMERLEAAKLLESKVKRYSDIPLIKSQAMIMEFFGPFKKLGVADLEKRIDAPNKTIQNLEKSGAENKGILAKIQEIGKLEKAVKNVSLGNVVQAEANLDAYVDGLVDLYGMLKRTEDTEIRAKGKTLFGRAAATMRGMQKALQDATKELMSKVPSFTNIYSDADAEDLAVRAAGIKQSPMQQLKSFGQALVGGAGGGSAARTGGVRMEDANPVAKKEKAKKAK